MVETEDFDSPNEIIDFLIRKFEETFQSIGSNLNFDSSFQMIKMRIPLKLGETFIL